MKKIKVGIVGIGNMGSGHAKYLLEGEVPGAILNAVCDIKQTRLDWAREKYGDGVSYFDNATAMFKSGKVDAVMIATPHYLHPPLAIEAMELGLHVLVEKPAGVYVKQVRKMNEFAQKSGKVFGVMFNQRTNPIYQKTRELIQFGELGNLKRINWIITNWYRPQSYYDSGDWRATWEGEGGGVLFNQSPHNLDLWQWICGMPKRIRAFCYFGKYHDIEVEDDVTAFMEYENGATGVFITSTADAPGTNRLEITGDNGKLIVEGKNLTFDKLKVSERVFNSEWKGGFGTPEHEVINVPYEGDFLHHKGITRSWINSILTGEPLMAPGIEGINGVILANAMILSTWTDNWVDLPMDENLYVELLNEKIRYSKNTKKKSGAGKVLDLSNTYNS